MIVIIDYGLGNLNSITNMLKKLETQAMISSDADVIGAADKLILPGMGAFDVGMQNLNERQLMPILNELVLVKKIRVLGLCLGLQLMANCSEEGLQSGLGWLDAEVVRFKFSDEQSGLKIPHMSWNTLDIQEYDDYQKTQSDAKDGVFDSIGSTFARLEPGAPVPHSVIPLCAPEVGQNERIYIKECLDTNWVSSVGPFVTRFEEMTAGYVDVKFGVATCSGTAALHTALLVAGIKPNDEVLLSTLTFIAPANAIRYAGAWPVFIDAEPDYWQMDVQKLKDFPVRDCNWRNGFLYNRITRRRVMAIMPVHILGHPCDMDPILDLARKYNLRVIEDATESLGQNTMDCLWDTWVISLVSVSMAIKSSLLAAA